MEQINKTIQEAISGLTQNGLGRIKYMPYKMDFALSVIDRIGKGIDPNFDMSPDLRLIYEQLIKYFHGDPEFNGDLCKGILLMGPTGTGKTLAMKIMGVYRKIDDIKFIMNSHTYRMNFEIIDVNRAINAFLDEAFDGIEMYCNRYVLCLDDLGSEVEKVKHYGNTLDVISHILHERYAKMLLTFGTTNFPLKTLEEKYNDRIVSRMYCLFNFIIMNGPDYRKPINNNKDFKNIT